jgi:hypothetical protein
MEVIKLCPLCLFELKAIQEFQFDMIWGQFLSDIMHMPKYMKETAKNILHNGGSRPILSHAKSSHALTA